jgi:hypothetical protein
MTYATPTQFTVSSAILLDAKIAEVQTALDSLSWLTFSFARGYRMFKDVDGQRVAYPAVYQGKTSAHHASDYVNVFPNDNYASHSFVYVRQPQRMQRNDNGFHEYEADISVIVYYKLRDIDDTKGYHFSEELKYDVVEKLEALPELTVNEVFDDIEQVYSDFTAAAIESEFLAEGMGALRFDCTVNYSNDCKITNTYT